ncbi:MAG: hypothetical protein MJ105_04140 [Lachnospiraceae bacterium]|nr:hypothetical protein [Lachnospiraceae bacterium]
MERKNAVMNMMLGLGTIFLIVSLALKNTVAGEAMARLVVPVLCGGLGYLMGEKKKKSFGKKYILPYFAFALLYTVMIAILFFARKNGYDGTNLQIHVWQFANCNIEGCLWILLDLGVAAGIYRVLRRATGTVCTAVLSIVFHIAACLMTGLFSKASAVGINFGGYILLLGVALWRAMSYLLFLWIGDMAAKATASLAKKLGKKILLGFVFTIAAVAILIVTLNLKNRVPYFRTYFDTKSLFFGAAGIYQLAGICMIIGGTFIFDWIGKMSLLEFIGENMVVPIATISNFYVLTLAEKLAQKIFILFDNNFLTALTEIVVIVVIEGAGMFIFALLKKKVWKEV